MPKYKVRLSYIFETTIDAPSEVVAKNTADFVIDEQNEYYLYRIEKKIIEIDGKSVFDTFENVEKVKPSELYPG